MERDIERERKGVDMGPARVCAASPINKSPKVLCTT